MEEIEEMMRKIYEKVILTNSFSKYVWNYHNNT
jgi:hypothetical protein